MISYNTKLLFIKPIFYLVNISVIIINFKLVQECCYWEWELIARWMLAWILDGSHKNTIGEQGNEKQLLKWRRSPFSRFYQALNRVMQCSSIPLAVKSSWHVPITIYNLKQYNHQTIYQVFVYLGWFYCTKPMKQELPSGLAIHVLSCSKFSFNSL